MALFKAMAGANKTALDNQPLTQGYCWFTTEDGKFYIDALANQQDTTTLTRFVLNAEKADKDGDGNIIKNTYLPLTGGTLTGDLSLLTGNVDRNINFLTGSTYNWRIQHTANDNRFNIQSTKATTDTWENALSIGCEDHDAIFSGAITAASFSGAGTSLTALNASNILEGTISADRLPEATSSVKGAVKVGTGISVSNGTISVSGLAIAQASTPGEQYTLWIDTDEEAQAAMPLNGPKYKNFSITTSNWSGSGPYTYNLTMNGVTSSDAVITLNLDIASQGHLKAQLNWETTANTVKLSTSTKPTGNISGYLITLPVTSV